MPLSVCSSGVYVFFLKNHDVKNVNIDFFIVCFCFSIIII